MFSHEICRPNRFRNFDRPSMTSGSVSNALLLSNKKTRDTFQRNYFFMIIELT